MKYAIIQTGGKQYRVTEGEEVLIDRLIGADKQHIFTDVLLLRTEHDTVVGMPFIPNTKVIGTVVGEEKGAKLHVARFSAKVRHRRAIGFRPIYTRIRIADIDTGVANKEIREPKKELKTKIKTAKVKVAPKKKI